METRKYLLGQVGGFPLRLSWLPRAYLIYGKKQFLPRDLEEISCDLGIGKNMAKSLRIWGLASGILSEKDGFTPLANSLFRRDRYFESIESIALLHWFICSNQKFFTSNAWLFNYFHAGKFTVKQAVSKFLEFLASSGAKYAEGTVRVDIETALRMYASLHDRKAIGMDDKFLHPLGLFSAQRVEGKTLFTRTWETERPLVSTRVMAYAVLSALATKKTDKSTLSDLYLPSNAHPAPGVVFGYTRDGFYSAIEKLAHSDSKSFSLTSLPGGDFQLAVRTRLSGKCRRGSLSVAEEYCFPIVN